jgi:hypothetical protein
VTRRSNSDQRQAKKPVNKSVKGTPPAMCARACRRVKPEPAWAWSVAQQRTVAQAVAAAQGVFEARIVVAARLGEAFGQALDDLLYELQWAYYRRAGEIDLRKPRKRKP